MSELAADRPEVPKPPNWRYILAALLELGMVATFSVHRSIVGLLLCSAYAWYSATWALLFPRND